MISVEQAISLVLGAARPLPAEEVPLDAALGRVLAGDATARCDDPPFDASAMDGYAVRSADAARASEESPAWLALKGVAPAGGETPPPIGHGEAVRVLTGAPVPAGADAVVMQERTRAGDGPEGPRVAVLEAPRPGDHLRPAGGEFRAGDVVLERGTLLGSAGLGLLAKAGIDRVGVHRRARVAVFSTGDELVPVAEALGPGQIHESNLTALVAAATSLGADVTSLGIVRDDPAAIARAVQAGLEHDVLVTSGGVSVGDRDYVKEIFGAHGVETVFWKVRVKPGKPVFFGAGPEGALGRRPLVFGLPGNPASCLLVFEILAAPAIRRLQGAPSPQLPEVGASLEETVRQPLGRRQYVRAYCWGDASGLRVVPVGSFDSSSLLGYARANAFIVLGEDDEVRAAGEMARVVLFGLPGAGPPVAAGARGASGRGARS